MSFLQNLWRDLVDKRLWPVAVALLLAAAAVPFLIGGGSDAGDVAAAPVPATAAPAVTDPAISVAVASDAKRASSKGAARDPFKALVFAKVKKDAAAAATATTPKAATPATSTTTTTGTTPSGNLATGSTGGKGTGTATGTPGTTTTPKTTTSTATTTKLFTYAIAVGIKRSGTMTSRHAVRPVSYLPTNANRLLAFLGVKSDGVTASFLVGEGVQVISGTGDCSPTPANCNLVELKAGQNVLVARTPAVGQPIKRFRVVLQRTFLARVPKTAAKPTEAAKPTAAARKSATTRSVRARRASATVVESLLGLRVAPGRAVTRTTRTTG